MPGKLPAKGFFSSQLARAGVGVYTDQAHCVSPYQLLSKVHIYPR